MVVGRNSISGVQLTAFVERVESIRASKKALSEDEAVIMAEAKQAGFQPGGIRALVKIRAMKPSVRQEGEAILDGYLHAIGMASDTPLFRHVAMIDVDTTSRESVVDALKRFVPDNGSITVEAGGRPIRLTRDEKGDVTAVEVVDKPKREKSQAGSARSPMQRAEPPDVDPDEAEDLGREAFKGNQPIIGNPFPFGDTRRPRWDAGWRKESGTDGMGPDD